MPKDPRYIALLNTTRWRSLRNAYLSQHPLCEDCEAAGRTTPAAEVHHVIPIEDAPSIKAMAMLAYDPTNLRALCSACHVAEHQTLGRGNCKARTKRQTAAALHYAARLLDDPGGVF